MTPAERADLLKRKAVELGFELCGVSAVKTPDSYPDFLQWLQKGYAGEMGWHVPQSSLSPELASGDEPERADTATIGQAKPDPSKMKAGYLERRKAERGDPTTLLPGARWVVSVALSYNPAPEHYPLLERHPISCYAWGRDYHEVVGEKLEQLAAFLKELEPGAQAKTYVDTGPIMERSFAAAAGLGWIGKNTLLLNKKWGSFLFLGEVLTDAALVPDAPVENLCKTCTACMDACPVGALEEPGLLNANKCISYLTLEHRSDLPKEAQLHGYLAGCDLCQTACPYNTQAPAGREKGFQPRPEVLALTLEGSSALSESAFKALTKDSALERIKYPMWKRNVARQGTPPA